jgi:3-deoxy-manno-octulosonate cytidylyltransferase (CMP-KDO synthetase)
MTILGIIPARYASTRFPAKALASIGGMSMIERVYRQAQQSKSLNKIIIATDHREIADHVRSFGADVRMTSPDHASGTDRCREVLSKESDVDYVINIQGDEPFIAPAQIDLLATLLDGKTELATLVKKIDSVEQLFNPNVVKVVCNKKMEAIYFSRAAIPHVRNQPQAEWVTHHAYYKHIGMYAYRADTLKTITGLPVSGLEKSESLEQLRWIENGYTLKVIETRLETIGIDTPEDLDKAIDYLKTLA